MDSPGLPPTWGLKQHYLCELEHNPPPAILEVEARLRSLYSDLYDIIHMPSFDEGEAEAEAEADGSATSSSRAKIRRSNFVGNAAVYGDAFQWHVDADPRTGGPTPSWPHGAYTNGTLGKPLFVSLVIYCDEEWRPEWDAETLFVEPSSGVGLLVQPRPGRAVLMHQDVLHRLSTPSQTAHRPRYSLVWKLLFLPKKEDDKEARERETILLKEWGVPLRLGGGVS